MCALPLTGWEVLENYRGLTSSTKDAVNHKAKPCCNGNNNNDNNQETCSIPG